MTDRMDCQFIMGMFTYVYCRVFIASAMMDASHILELISHLTIEDQWIIFKQLNNTLMEVIWRSSILEQFTRNKNTIMGKKMFSIQRFRHVGKHQQDWPQLLFDGCLCLAIHWAQCHCWSQQTIRIGFQALALQNLSNWNQQKPELWVKRRIHKQLTDKSF